MKRAIVVGALLTILILSFQNCGKLGNTGAPGTSNFQSMSQLSGNFANVYQYQDQGQLAAGQTATIKNLSPTQVGDLFVVMFQDAPLSAVSNAPGVVGCPCVPTDTAGNTYINVPGTVIFYAVNTVASPAGSNVITLNFSSTQGTTQRVELLFYELVGMQTSSPLDTFVNVPTSGNFSTSITTTNANDFIVGELYTTGAGCVTWSNGWSMQVTDHYNCWASLNTSAPGTYTASGTAVGTAAIQLAAFKKATTSKPQFALQQITNSITSTAKTTANTILASDQLAGDLNIVLASWNAGSSTTITGPVTDTKGNVYTLVWTNNTTGLSESFWYAQNIKPAAAGTNTVSIQLSSAVNIQMVVAEYSGSTTGSGIPLDRAMGLTGTGTVASSGSITTNYPNDLIIATITENAGQDVNGFPSGYRVLPLQNYNVDPGLPWYSMVDSFAANTGTFSTSFNLSSSQTWIATINAFH